MSALKLHSSALIDIYSAKSDAALEFPVFNDIKAGFPSPAGDFIDQSIDLNRHLIKHPSATFFGRVKGESMKDAGINDDDLLVIDKSIEPINGKIAVCFIDGEFTLKRIKKDKTGLWLMPENKDFQPIQITEENDLRVFGVVTHVIKSF